MTASRETVARAGIDVGSLIDDLTTAAQAELALTYRYTIVSRDAAGLADESLRAILRDIRTEDRHHFDTLVTRILELGGHLPAQLHEFFVPLDKPADTSDLLMALIAAEQQAIATYTNLCALTAARDPRTHTLAEAMRNEEIEHEAWLNEYRGTGPPARLHRGFRGNSPFLRHQAPTDQDPVG